MNAVESHDVIDVRVRDYDRANLQVMALNDLQDSFGVVARIDHDSVARVRVADNVAIALQHANGKDLMNKFCGFRT